MTTDRIALLDHGYLQLKEAWGSDEKIVAAARMSTGKGFLGWDPGPCEACGGTGRAQGPILQTIPLTTLLIGDPEGFNASDLEMTYLEGDLPCRVCVGKGVLAGDIKLLAYLYKNRHHTPFEMGGMQVESAAPIMVYREWERHRTQSFNEMSGRYVPLPDINYIPSVERIMRAAGANRQAGRVAGAGDVTVVAAESYRVALADMYRRQERLYQAALAVGVPKELARAHVGVGRYSRLLAQGVLRNILAFITLRDDSAAMWEIQVYARAWGVFVAEAFPRTWELFQEARGA